MYIRVCIEQIKNRAIVNPFNWHMKSPKIQFPSMMVTKLIGMSSIATNMSAAARFTMNILVLVRIPLWRRMVKITMIFPPTANTIMRTIITANGTTTGYP